MSHMQTSSYIWRRYYYRKFFLIFFRLKEIIFFPITVYLVLGVVGLPIFQGHNGGLDYFMGVTGGYLIGFFFASILGSFLSTRGLRSGLSIWAMLYANIVIYIPALIWLSIFDFSESQKELFAKLLDIILPTSPPTIMLPETSPEEYEL